MATFNTDISTAQAAAAVNASAVVKDSRRVDGPIEFIDSVYTISAGPTEATNDVINLGSIAIGAIVYPENSFAFLETDPGTLLTVNIGDSLDADRYAAAINISAPGKVEYTSAQANVAGVVTRHETTDVTCKLIATIVGTVTALTAGTKIHFKTAYKCLGT